MPGFTYIQDGGSTRTGTVDDTNKTKAQLIEELAALRTQVADLAAADAHRDLLEEELRLQSHQLGERVKELKYLYGISALFEETPDSLQDILQGVVDLIPPAWQYPEITCARLLLGDQQYQSGEFKETPWYLSRQIISAGTASGAIEVFYMEERPVLDEGPFLKEERLLIDAIAERLGKAVERLSARQALRKSEERLRRVAASTPAYIYELDADGRITYANRTYEGVSHEQVVGTPLTDWFPANLRPTIDELVQRVVASGEAESLEYSIPDPEGVVRSYLADVLPAWQDDEMAGAVLTAVDISQHKAAEMERDTAFVALRNAINEQKKSLKELAAIHAAGQRLQQLLTPESLAQEIISVLEETLTYEYGAVLFVDEATGMLIPFALSAQGRGADFVEQDRAYVLSHGIKLGKGISGWVAETGQSVCLGDVRRDSRYYPMREEIRSELCVPLRAGDQLLGVVNVESTRVNAYSQADKRVMETVAAQMAIAIQNARLVELLRDQAHELEERVAARTTDLSALNERLQNEVEQRADAEEKLAYRVRELAALHETLQAVTSRTNLATVFKVVLQRAAEIAVARMATLYLLRPEDGSLEVVAVHNLPALSVGVRVGPGEGIAGRVVQTGEPLAVANYTEWAGRFSSSPLPKLGRALAVPLKLGDRIIGAISLMDSERTGEFDGDEIQLAGLLADHAAIAVENARLFTEAHQDHPVRRDEERSPRPSTRAQHVLSESRWILSHGRDAPQMLIGVCRTAVESGGYRLAWIGLAEQDEGKTVRPAAQAGYEQGYLDTLRITWADDERGRGPTGTAIRTRKPSVSRNIQEDPRFAPWRERATRRGYASSIALPLLVGNECLGALNIYAQEPDAFDTGEIELLMKLAEDLASGLDSLRVRAERRQALEELRARALALARSEALMMGLARVSARLEATRDPQQILETLGAELEKLRMTCLAYLLDPESQQLVSHYVSIDPDLVAQAEKLAGMRLIGYRVPSEIWAVQNLREHERPVFVQDPAELGKLLALGMPAEAVEPVLRLAGLSSETSAIYLPLVVEGLAIGALVVWGPDLRPEDIPALEVFAGQVAGALENATLLRAERQRTIELSTLLNATQLLSSTRNLEETLTLIAEQATMAVGVDGCSLSRWDREADAIVTWIEWRQDTLPPEGAGVTYALDDFPATRAVLETRQPLIIRASDPDADAAEVAHMRAEGTVSLLILPLATGDQVLGLVELDLTARDIEFSPAQVRLAQALSDQAAVAVHNAQLVQEASELEILRSVDRLRSDLLANVSHELRTPLGLIKIFASTLLREDVDFDAETLHEFLSNIDEEADNLELIVENLMGLSRVDAGRLRRARQPVDIGRLSARVGASLEAKYPQHHFAYDFPGVPLVVPADRSSLEQIFRNLLDNAAKYSPGGGTITVTGRLREASARVQVIDEGIGIAADELPRLFGRFYRIESELSRETRGAGLGLAISKDLVEAHGGQLWVQSTPGAGSTFSFVLPLQPEAEDSAAELYYT